MLALGGCWGEGHDYSQARSLDTVEAYRYYIKLYPESDRNDAARLHISIAKARAARDLEALTRIARDAPDDDVREAAECSQTLIGADGAPSVAAYQEFVSRCAGACCGSAIEEGIESLLADSQLIESYGQGLASAREGDVQEALTGVVSLLTNTAEQPYVLHWAALILRDLGRSESLDLQLDSEDSWTSADEIPVAPQLRSIAATAMAEPTSVDDSSPHAASDLLTELVRLRLKGLVQLQEKQAAGRLADVANLIRGFDFRQSNAGSAFNVESSALRGRWADAAASFEENAVVEVKTLVRRYDQGLRYGQRLGVLQTLLLLDRELITADDELASEVARACGDEEEEELVELCNKALG